MWNLKYDTNEHICETETKLADIKNRLVYSTRFTAALFTIARTWKQPKCLLTDEWIKKMWHIYTMEYYSAIK